MNTLNLGKDVLKSVERQFYLECVCMCAHARSHTQTQAQTWVWQNKWPVWLLGGSYSWYGEI